MALSNHEFTGLTAVLRRVLDRWARNKLQTSMPGTVVSYNSSAQTASVKPDVGGGTRLDDVPVLFPGTEDGMLKFDLSSGDRVWIFWSKYDLMAWKNAGYRRVSGDRAVLSVASAVCMPWALNAPNLLDRLIPEGGSEGQVLKKGMGDFDYEWGTDETS